MEYSRKRIRKIKLSMVEKAGGVCAHCGYKFNGNNECVFDFHHVNPEEKLFLLNKGTLNRISLKNAWIEFEKCIMVCTRCHRLIHNEYGEEESVK